MPKPPRVSGKETIKALQKIGFVFSGQSGGHIKLVRQFGDGKQTVTVPMHKELKKGTLRNGILKAINLSVEDFRELL